MSASEIGKKRQAASWERFRKAQAAKAAKAASEASTTKQQPSISVNVKTGVVTRGDPGWSIDRGEQKRTLPRPAPTPRPTVATPPKKVDARTNPAQAGATTTVAKQWKPVDIGAEIQKKNRPLGWRPPLKAPDMPTTQTATAAPKMSFSAQRVKEAIAGVGLAVAGAIGLKATYDTFKPRGTKPAPPKPAAPAAKPAFSPAIQKQLDQYEARPSTARNRARLAEAQATNAARTEPGPRERSAQRLRDAFNASDRARAREAAKTGARSIVELEKATAPTPAPKPAPAATPAPPKPVTASTPEQEIAASRALRANAPKPPKPPKSEAAAEVAASKAARGKPATPKPAPTPAPAPAKAAAPKPTPAPRAPAAKSPSADWTPAQREARIKELEAMIGEEAKAQTAPRPTPAPAPSKQLPDPAQLNQDRAEFEESLQKPASAPKKPRKPRAPKAAPTPAPTAPAAQAAPATGPSLAERKLALTRAREAEKSGDVEKMRAARDLLHTDSKSGRKVHERLTARIEGAGKPAAPAAPAPVAAPPAAAAPATPSEAPTTGLSLADRKMALVRAREAEKSGDVEKMRTARDLLQTDSKAGKIVHARLTARIEGAATPAPAAPAPAPKAPAPAPDAPKATPSTAAEMTQEQRDARIAELERALGEDKKPAKAPRAKKEPTEKQVQSARDRYHRQRKKNIEANKNKVNEAVQTQTIEPGTASQEKAAEQALANKQAQSAKTELELKQAADKPKEERYGNRPTPTGKDDLAKRFGATEADIAAQARKLEYVPPETPEQKAARQKALEGAPLEVRQLDDKARELRIKELEAFGIEDNIREATERSKRSPGGALLEAEARARGTTTGYVPRQEEMPWPDADDRLAAARRQAEKGVSGKGFAEELMNVENRRLESDRRAYDDRRAAERESTERRGDVRRAGDAGKAYEGIQTSPVKAPERRRPSYAEGLDELDIKDIRTRADAGDPVSKNFLEKITAELQHKQKGRREGEPNNLKKRLEGSIRTQLQELEDAKTPKVLGPYDPDTALAKPRGSIASQSMFSLEQVRERANRIVKMIRDPGKALYKGPEIVAALDRQIAGEPPIVVAPRSTRALPPAADLAKEQATARATFGTPESRARAAAEGRAAGRLGELPDLTKETKRGPGHGLNPPPGRPGHVPRETVTKPFEGFNPEDLPQGLTEEQRQERVARRYAARRDPGPKPPTVTNPSVGTHVGANIRTNVMKPSVRGAIMDSLKRGGPAGVALGALFVGADAARAAQAEPDPTKKAEAAKEAATISAKVNAAMTAGFAGLAKGAAMIGPRAALAVGALGTAGVVGGGLYGAYQIGQAANAARHIPEGIRARRAAEKERKASEAKYGTVEAATRTRHARARAKIAEAQNKKPAKPPARVPTITLDQAGDLLDKYR